MKKILFLLIVSFLFTGFALASDNFAKQSNKNPQFLQKGESKFWCPICGMNLKNFYKTNHAVKLKNGETKQYCSIRCLAVDYKNIKDNIEKIYVVDVKSKKFIDVYKAYYVVGSKVKGTMSKLSKLAFANKKDAENFINKKSGKLADFNTAFNIAKKTLKNDIAMINKKKQKKIYPMGRKIYKKRCQKINPNNFNKINDLKAEIKNKKLCGNLKEKQLQMVALYLWEIDRLGKNLNNKKIIKVSKKEKCPVCGMFVYKYPKWVARIYFIKDNKKDFVSFDGVKDFMKFYFEPSKWGNYKNIIIKNMLVTDYYSQNAIKAKDAYYVVGSDVFGPMGNELIAFKNIEDASNFMKEHNGKQLLRFSSITKKIVYDLDK